MDKEGVNVIVTCCGNTVSPGMIASLKKVTERKVNVIGVDMNPDGIGPHFVDKFFLVPRGDSAEYVDVMLEICKKERIHVILPCDDNECLALAKYHKEFEEIGTLVAASDYEMLEIALNKGKLYQFLKEKGVPYPKFTIVNNLQEFEDAVYEMGYPRKNVMVKKLKSFGGRGARILSRQNIVNQFYDEKPSSFVVPLEYVTKTFEESEDMFRPMLVTEYLTGKFYSVEVLSKDGMPLYIVPKIRIEGSPSNTTVGKIDLNEDVIEVARKTCNSFGFSYVQNYEMKYSEEDIPIPYDVNPRIPASVAFPTAAGVNLIYFAVKMALGEDIPDLPVKNGVMMLRYYNELFI